ncbi:unnamed protein product [Phytomonas sp. Hart1]|nr:unnamed protein product [Phytomonas sp. Hart1]|eukprot:CCW67403.1 unnamed protein product [Phytomonas sp. isolate Hart1]
MPLLDWTNNGCNEVPSIDYDAADVSLIEKGATISQLVHGCRSGHSGLVNLEKGGPTLIHHAPLNANFQLSTAKRNETTRDFLGEGRLNLTLRIPKTRRDASTQTFPYQENPSEISFLHTDYDCLEAQKKAFVAQLCELYTLLHLVFA